MVDELLSWLDSATQILDSASPPVYGDPKLIEAELAKLKVVLLALSLVRIALAHLLLFVITTDWCGCRIVECNSAKFNFRVAKFDIL